MKGGGWVATWAAPKGAGRLQLFGEPAGLCSSPPPGAHPFSRHLGPVAGTRAPARPPSLPPSSPRVRVTRARGLVRGSARRGHLPGLLPWRVAAAAAAASGAAGLGVGAESALGPAPAFPASPSPGAEGAREPSLDPDGVKGQEGGLAAWSLPRAGLIGSTLHPRAVLLAAASCPAECHIGG